MQRRHTITTPVWPYIAVVTCLFVLAILATRLWRASGNPNDGRTRTLGPEVADYPTDAEQQTNPVQDGMPKLDDFMAPGKVASVSPQVTRRVESMPAPPSLPTPPELEAGLRFASLPPLRSNETRDELLPEVTMQPVSKRSSEAIDAANSGWPFPSALVKQLEDLSNESVCGEWAKTTIAGIQDLLRTDCADASACQAKFSNLETLAQSVDQLAQKPEAAAYKSHLLRARYAMLRRIALWKQVREIVARGADTYTVSLSDSSELSRSLDVVDRRLGASQLGTEWRRYLCLDELRLCLQAGDLERQRHVARSVLNRLHSQQFDEGQSSFMQEASFNGFSDALSRCVDEPVDYSQVLESLELYEETNSATCAGDLARYYQVIRWSRSNDVKALGDRLNTYYRNANLRVTVSAALLNRMLPGSVTTDEPVRDTLLGAQVRGMSRNASRLRVVLTPDQHIWNVGLEVDGTVNSRTAASRGPARFFSNGWSRYAGRKLITVDRQGVHTDSADVRANMDMDLSGVETNFDSVPILGWVARAVAVEQHERNSEEARWLAAMKLRHMASNRINEEVDKQIADAEQQFQKNWLKPLRGLNLQPVVLDMQTSTDELTVRYRLASDDQLAAHTPRPEPPAGNLMSVQIHETALNNTLEQLHLDGQQFDIKSLYKHLADAFQRSEFKLPDDIPDDIVVRFASKNAVRVRCEDNRLGVTLRIAELKNGPRTEWRNFSVRAYYVPDTARIDARLVRDGGIELVGNRDIQLRAIFSKVFSSSRPITLVNHQMADDPQWADVKISQFAINDGWIGVALNQEEAKATPEVAKKVNAPETPDAVETTDKSDCAAK